MTAPAAEGCMGEDKGPNLTFLRALRVLKSARILRMLRVVRFLRELRLMLDCIINSVFHLVWSVIIIVLILLMYALLIVQGLNTYVENAPLEHQEQQAYAKELSKMFYSKLDQNHDGGITLREFKDHLQDPEVVSFFLARDINVTDAEMFFHMLSSIHGADKVNIKTFTKAILRLRGNASAIDMQAFHFDLKCMAMESTLCLHKLTDLFERIL